MLKEKGSRKMLKWRFECFVLSEKSRAENQQIKRKAFSCFVWAELKVSPSEQLKT